MNLAFWKMLLVDSFSKLCFRVFTISFLFSGSDFSTLIEIFFRIEVFDRIGSLYGVVSINDFFSDEAPTHLIFFNVLTEFGLLVNNPCLS